MKQISATHWHVDELDAEPDQDFKIPVLWEDHDCYKLENFESDYSTKHKGHNFHDTDFGSLWDQEKTDCFSRKDGVVPLYHNWNSHIHFDSAPDQHGIVSVVDTFSLPTAPSILLSWTERSFPSSEKLSHML